MSESVLLMMKATAIDSICAFLHSYNYPAIFWQKYMVNQFALPCNRICCDDSEKNLNETT